MEIEWNSEEAQSRSVPLTDYSTVSSLADSVPVMFHLGGPSGEVGRIHLVEGIWHFTGDTDKCIQLFVMNIRANCNIDKLNCISMGFDDCRCVINLKDETITAKQPVSSSLMAFSIKLFKEYNAIHG